ncbi:primosomal replication protein PriC [Thalassotalea crassostreae]|uniref:primosomal replication protein PriC n=1 Tax=Thalassotalea crassostreae TaxID=1763536 RepID=UPI0008395E9F|nr:primosomal replication protein PriC [Thalassotalea crassostreae]
MKQSLLRLQQLLMQLADDAKQADLANKNNKAHYYLHDQPLFDEKLFPIASSSYNVYVSYTQKRLAHLQKLLNSNKAEVANMMFQGLEEQVMALINAIKSNDNRHHDGDYRLDRRNRLNKLKDKHKQPSAAHRKAATKIILPSQQLYQKLSEYHGFERRLLDMVQEKQDNLNRCKADSQNSKDIQQQLLALHQRLGRCRKAISEVEKQIEDSETSR